jgi:hypothetical protein
MKTINYLLLGLTIILGLVSCNSKIKHQDDDDAAETNKTAYIINVSGYNNAEKAAITAMQGIINRSGAYVYLKNVDAWTNNIQLQAGKSLTNAIPADLLKKYPFADLYWIDYYKEKHDYTFIDATPESLYNTFKDKFKGVIFFGAANNDVCLPTTVLNCASMEDAIPVNANLLNGKFNFLKTGVDNGTLSTIHNLADMFSTPFEAQQWAIDKYLSKTANDFVGSSYNEGEAGTYQNDYVIQKKGFMFQLNFATNRANDAPLLDRILDRMAPLSFVWGWGAGGEEAIISRLAPKGMVLLCANCPNGSFHAAVKPLSNTFTQKNKTNAATVTLENKVYIAFMINEGDTYKTMAGLYNMGSWLHSARGTLPINWGTDPLLFDLLPALMEFYYNEAKSGDYFFNATSGYGYTHPASFNKEYLPLLQSATKKSSQKADTEYLDIWYFSGMANRWSWVKGAGMKGVTLWEGAQRTYYPLDGVIAIESNLYYYYEKLGNGEAVGSRISIEKQPEYTADKIRQSYSATTPKFVVVYGGDPALFKATYDNLLAGENGNKYEAVTIDKMFMLAEKAKK